MADEQKVRKYVRGACERCRRQKLKCDVNRPCMLCCRAGVECIGGNDAGLRRSRGPQSQSGKRRASRVASQGAVSYSSSSRRARNVKGTPKSSAVAERHTSDGGTHVLDVQRIDRDLNNLGQKHVTIWGSSATLALVETANLYSEDAIPPVVGGMSEQGSADIQCVPNQTEIETDRRHISDGLASAAINGPVQRGRALKRPSGVRQLDKLLDVLPQIEATDLLVDTYFDRVHWFMLVFHQEDFRNRLKQLQNALNISRSVDESSTGFVALLITVICIALQYLGPHRVNLLEATGTDKENLQQRILTTLEESFLAIISLGNLESVQVCVLLGSFYLYHGDPTTAWPICGCALRIGQALNLHRKWVTNEERMSLSPITSLEVEARKRCWWALYELETFCCMLYGYTCTISDEECDVGFLNTSPPPNADPLSESVSDSVFNLLTYKVMMSKLSTIVKATLTELYGHDQLLTGANGNFSLIEEKLEQVIAKVDNLNARLSQWHSKLPAQLKRHESDICGYRTIQQSEEDLGGSGPIFDQQMIQLQAIALTFAYENARILINRPLLCYKLNRVRSRRHSGHLATSQGESVPVHIQTALEVCQNAAMRTATMGEMPGFKFAIRSYAAAFMSTHIFTAGVALSLSAIIDPLTEKAAEAKNGLRKLIQLQNSPLAEPLASGHVTIILERLIRLMLEKELNMLMGFDTRSLHNTRGERDPTLEPDCVEAIAGAGTTESHRLLAGSAVDNQANELSSITQQPRTEEIEFSDPFPLYLMDDTVTVEALRQFENVLSSLATDVTQNDAQLLGCSHNYGNVPSPTDQEQAWIWSLDPNMRL